VSDFVDECRQEWTRLGVPDAVANEMAADLTADLHEAEVEGVSAEEVVGSAVFDPRSFAASWATERGVVPDTAAPGGAPVLVEERPGRTRMLAVVAALAVFAIAGAALLTRAFHSAGVIGSVRKVVPAPFVEPGPGLRYPKFAIHGPGPDPTHGIAVLLLFVGVLGLVAATVYWSRRAKPNH